MLASRPQSVEDITIAQKNWREIDGRRDNMQAKSRGLLDLGSILGLHAAGTHIDTAGLSGKASSLSARWTAFTDQMEAFNEMIEIQKGALKARLEEHVIEQNQAIDKFAERWRALRPTDLDLWDLDNVRRTFDELNEPICRVLKRQFDNFSVWIQVAGPIARFQRSS